MRGSAARSWFLFGCVAVAAVAVGPALGSRVVDLNKLVLTGSQVGSGYQLKQRADGHAPVAATVTLDFCGFKFRSEALRTARVQVDYARRGSTLRASNEVVTYKSGGAQKALREVTTAVRSCPRRPVGSNVQGVPPLSYRVKRVEHSGLLAGYVAFELHVSGVVKKKRFARAAVVVYQAHGKVLSGVYTYGSSLGARLNLVFHAGMKSAKNLTRA